MTDALEGGCTCRAVRYRLTDTPLFVHCCHCSWCQRETGAAFAVNALIESARVVLIEGAPVKCMLPSASGSGQVFVRCPDCGVTVWSHYAGMGDKASFEHAMKVNIEKLRARYPNKFSEHDAVNRDLKTERQILEQ